MTAPAELDAEFRVLDESDAPAAGAKMMINKRNTQGWIRTCRSMEAFSGIEKGSLPPKQQQQQHAKKKKRRLRKFRCLLPSTTNCRPLLKRRKKTVTTSFCFRNFY